MSCQTIFFCIQLVIFLQMNLGLLQLQPVRLDLKSRRTPNAEKINNNIVIVKNSNWVLQYFINIQI